jgi:hypothetical protein
MSNRNGNRGQMPAPPTPVKDAEMPTLSVPEQTEPAQASQDLELEKKQDAAVEAPAAPTHIDVIATRLGFFDGRRISAGEVFQLESMKQFGSWMKLADPKAEAARVADEKKKKEAGK